MKPIFLLKLTLSQNFIDRYGLPMVMGLFFVLASIGIFFSFGMSHAVGDESVVTTTVLKMIGRHTLIPADQFNYHMALPAYVYLPFFAIAIVLLRLLGIFTSVDELTAFATLDWGYLLPLARFISVLAGLVSLWLLYKIAKRLFGGMWVPLLSVYLLATHLLFVMLAHFGKVWMLQLAALLTAVYFIVKLFDRAHPWLRDYAYVGLSVAASFGMHFIGILVYVPFFIAHALKERGKKFSEKFIRHRGFWLANSIIVISIPFLYFLNPYGLENYIHRALTGLSSLLGGVPAPDVEETAGLFEKMTFYGRILFNYQPLMTALFIPAAVVFFLRERFWFYIFGGFVVAYYIVIGPLVGGGGLLFEPRFILPVIPFMCLITAYMLARYMDASWTFFSHRIKVVLLVVFLLFALYPPILYDYRIAGSYTTEQAFRWTEGHIPRGSSIIHFDFGSPIPLNENKEALEDIRRLNPVFFTTAREFLLTHNDIRLSREPSYYVVNTSYYWKRDVPQELIDRSYEYIIVSYWDQDRLDIVQKQLAQFGINSEDFELLENFPEGGEWQREGFNITGRMTRPLEELLKHNEAGPLVFIYRSISKDK